MPLGQQHSYKGKMISFLNDSSDGNLVPTLVRLENVDFQEVKVWFCPDPQVVMDENHTMMEVLPVVKMQTLPSPPRLFPFCYSWYLSYSTEEIHQIQFVPFNFVWMSFLITHPKFYKKQHSTSMIFAGSNRF